MKTIKDCRNTVEESFFKWCTEAKVANIIHSFEYEPEQILLIDKAATVRYKQQKKGLKMIDKFLFHSLKYTPDFYIKSKFNLEKIGLVYTHIDDGLYFYSIDTKGGFQQYNDAKYFSAIQKIVYLIKGMVVNKVICEKWFLKTFCPMPTRLEDDLVWTNAGKQPRRKRKKFTNCPTLEHSKTKYTT